MSQAEGTTVFPLKRMDGQPVFDEPWQAQVLTMANSLIEQRAIEPEVWSEALGEALKRAEAEGEPDNVDTYYQAVLFCPGAPCDRPVWPLR